VGSFLNVVIDRLPQKRSIFAGRSVCDSCHKVLSPLELIPIVSYIVLGGRCKHCRTKIPARLTLVEALTGLAFAFSYVLLGANLFLLTLALFAVSINIAVFFIDLEYGIIPDELITLFIVISFVYIAVFTPSGTINHILTGFFAFLLFLALFLITRGRGLGFGDVKLAFAIGFFLGFPKIIPAFYCAFLTGAAVSVILILYGKKRLKSAVPFAPFLASGTLFAFFAGDAAINFVLTALSY
jgi:prepilin signal peptidase PulO-like enzyme (type II secretory pathway)